MLYTTFFHQKTLISREKYEIPFRNMKVLLIFKTFVQADHFTVQLLYKQNCIRYNICRSRTVYSTTSVQAELNTVQLLYKQTCIRYNLLYKQASIRYNPLYKQTCILYNLVTPRITAVQTAICFGKSVDVYLQGLLIFDADAREK
jgi:hypothetical protein